MDKQPLWQRILMGGAVAEAPSVMTAAGHNIEKDGTVTVDNQNDAGVKQLRSSLPVIGASAAISVAAPTTLSTAWKVLNHPITQTIGTIDGIRNLFTGNGVKKTYNHFKNGEYGKGTLSLAGDVLDASPLIGVWKAIKSGNEARKIFGNAIGLNYTIREMPIANLFNRHNRIGFELSKIPFQEPIYRTGYHVTRYAGDLDPFLHPDSFVNSHGNQIKLDYSPVRNPEDNIPVNTNWLGGNDMAYVTARPEIGIHVGATVAPGFIKAGRSFKSDRHIKPVVREVTWIDYPGSSRTMNDMKSWIVNGDTKSQWEQLGVNITESMNADRLFKNDGWFWDNNTTHDIEALKVSNALLDQLRKMGITSIDYNNKYELPFGWKHINGDQYRLPSGRIVHWPGAKSTAIITPEAWWSKNRRYIPSIPEKSIPFDWNARNRVFNQTGLGLGKNSPGALHASDPGSVYRITGEDQITDLLSSGYVRPKQSGKVKGGRTDEVHWSAGDDNLYYYDGRPVIEVKASNISENSPITSKDIKALYRKVNGKYVDVWPNIKPKIIQGFNLGGKLWKKQ